VARLHTELLKSQVFPDFNRLDPDRFVSITNGITPRRWLLACNPRLAAAISARVGDGWVRDLDRLGELRPYADDPVFQDEFLAIKRANKADLAAMVEQLCGVRCTSSRCTGGSRRTRPRRSRRGRSSSPARPPRRTAWPSSRSA
ncbi:MAG: hypothetical protein B7Z68_09885, partial [Acidobacteria bacterium 21-70-11]